MHETQDQVKLIHPNGTTVRVRKDIVPTLEAMGFTKPTSRSSNDSK